MAILTVTDPAKAHKLSEFLAAGASDKHISYKSLSFRNKEDTIIYTVKCVIEDYMYELKQMAVTIVLSDDEFAKYKYKPQILAYDIYGATELYPYILMLNNMCNIREFTQKTILLLSKENLISSLSSIYTSEKSSINEYNSHYE